MSTTTTCQSCGATIPEALEGDALCTACRYHHAPKAKAWDADETGNHAFEPAWVRDLPSQPERQPQQRILDALEDAGCTIPNRESALDAVEDAIDDAAIERTADFLRMLVMRLPGGRRGAELRLALLGAEESFASEGKALGIAPQILHRTVARLKRRMMRCT